MARRTAASALLALALLAAACGAPDEDAGTADQDIGPPTQTCTAPTFRVEYPAGWHVNSHVEAPACRWFHSEPFRVPNATEATGIAVHLRYERGGLSRLAGDAAEAGDVIERGLKHIDGRDAVRLRTRSNGKALLPAGILSVAWFIDAGPRTLVATTTSLGLGDFNENIAALDAIASSFRLMAPFACSAAGEQDVPAPAESLPEAVAATRVRLVTAATRCNFDSLADLADAGSRPFSFTFGGEEDAAQFWRTAERTGAETLRALVAVLSMGHARRPVDGGTQYVWPAAYAQPSWADVSAENKQALSALYGPDELSRFEQAGAYLGHRVGIAGDGEWIFFVAGD